MRFRVPRRGLTGPGSGLNFKLSHYPFAESMVFGDISGAGRPAIRWLKVIHPEAVVPSLQAFVGMSPAHDAVGEECQIRKLVHAQRGDVEANRPSGSENASWFCMCDPKLVEREIKECDAVLDRLSLH